MKMVFRLVVLGLVVLAAMNYMGYQKTGSLSFANWIADVKTITGNLIPKNQPADSQTKSTVKISKWTDSNGVVHYENRPVEGAKTLEVNPNDNIVPAAPIVELPASATESKPKTLNEEMQVLREAKQAQMEAIINR